MKIEIFNQKRIILNCEKRGPGLGFSGQAVDKPIPL